MTDLTGKVALVTGGGSGIGAAIALELAKAGANVMITGRRQKPLDELCKQHQQIKAITGDITDHTSVAEIFAATRNALGPADIVVANAGSAQSAPFAKTTLDQWNHMLEVNLTGVFLTFKQGLSEMNKSGWGRLISIASTAGLKGYGYVAPYCAAKHGVIGLTRSLAIETARSGITVNAVCPGFTETDMLADSIANIVEKTGMSEQDARHSLTGSNPMGRFIQPHEVAASVMWLVGPGSDAITGQAISVSGGETW